MPEDWRRSQKTAQLDEWIAISGAKWKQLKPDVRNTWLTEGQQADFYALMPIGTKNSDTTDSLFTLTSLGISTNREEWVYGFNPEAVKANVSNSVDNCLIECARYSTSRDKKNFKINADEKYLKWSDTLIRKLKSDQPPGHFHKKNIQAAMYRPFCQTNVYFDPLLIDRPSQHRLTFPPSTPMETSLIPATGYPDAQDFFV